MSSLFSGTDDKSRFKNEAKLCIPRSTHVPPLGKTDLSPLGGAQKATEDKTQGFFHLFKPIRGPKVCLLRNKIIIIYSLKYIHGP